MNKRIGTVLANASVAFVIVLGVVFAGTNTAIAADLGGFDDYGFAGDYGGFSDYYTGDYGFDDSGYSGSYGFDDSGFSDSYGFDDYGYGDYSDAGYSDYYDPGYSDYYESGYSDYYDSGSSDYYDAGYTDYYDSGYSDYYDAGYTDYYTDDSYDGYTDYYDDYVSNPGYAYGGGYSFGGGGYGVTGGGYPTTIYSPKYTTPVIPPTVITKPSKTVTTPTNNTIVNNNTNNNSNVNINNNTAVAVAQVQIGSQQTSQPQYPTYPAPYCTISYTQYTAYNYGTKQVYLSWTSSNASSAYLSGYGSVAVNGSQTVYAAASQTYTLTVYGYNGQQATCQTTVYGTTYTPTPYVSLTQIPYTGFDFGPIGNAAYWAGLVSVALAGAYLAVYYIPSLVFAGTATRAYAPVVAPKAPILVEREAALEAVNPIVATFRKAGTNDAMAIVKPNDGSMPKIVIERY